MTTQEAENILKDYLLNGIQSELFWAKEARAIAVIIGKHSQRINSTRFASLFGKLQEIFSERETLCIAKIFDRPSKKFPTRSIPSILNLISEHARVWSLPERIYLEDILSSVGYNLFERKNNEQISLETVEFFKRTLPSVDRKDIDDLSRALDRVFQSRDKVHAHNEAILRTERNLPSWTDTKILIEYTENFIKIISRSFLGLQEIVAEPEMMAKQFEMIMSISNLVSEDHIGENGNSWFIEEIRKELLISK